MPSSTSTRPSTSLNPSFLQGWVSSHPVLDPAGSVHHPGLNPSFLQGWVSRTLGARSLSAGATARSQAFLPPGMGFERRRRVLPRRCGRKSLNPSFLQGWVSRRRTTGPTRLWTRCLNPSFLQGWVSRVEHENPHPRRPPLLRVSILPSSRDGFRDDLPGSRQVGSLSGLNPSFLQGWVSRTCLHTHAGARVTSLNPSFLQGWVSRSRDDGVADPDGRGSQSFLPPGMGFESEVAGAVPVVVVVSQSFLPPGMGFEHDVSAGEEIVRALSLNPSFLQGWVSSPIGVSGQRCDMTASQSFLPPGMGFERASRASATTAGASGLNPSFLQGWVSRAALKSSIVRG